MGVPRLWLWISVWISLVLFRCVLSGAESDYIITDNVNLVLLDVSVKNANGKYVKGLARSNFNVAEDGRAVTISHFANLDGPVTVGLIVDNSGSMRLRRPEVVMAGLAFAKQSNPQDQFFVVNFNDRVLFGLPPAVAFTDQLQVLRSALYYGRPMGQTALYDAISAALQHLEVSTREKRTLIVVSDGQDNASRTTMREVLNMAQASRATIYTVGLVDPFDKDLNTKVLRKLASVTGGEFVKPQTQQEVLADFAAICRDVRSRYSIGYIPTLEGSKRNVHKVKVTARDVNGRKLSVLTRTSYSTALSQQFTAGERRAQ